VAALRAVSVAVATKALEVALREGVSQRADLVGEDRDALGAAVRSRMWSPQYLPYVPADEAR
jgi:hypothetical protein